MVSPLIAFGLVVGASFIIIALLKPIVLCYLMIAVIAFASGVERGHLVPLLALNELSLLLSTGIAFLVVIVRKHSYRAGPKEPTTAFIILFIGSVFMPITIYLLQNTQLTVDGAFKIAAPLQFLLLFWLFSSVPEGESHRRGLVCWMLICGSIVAVVGLLQGAGVGFVTRLLDEWYPSRHGAMASYVGRVTSLLGSWNALGIFLMVNFIVGWAVLPTYGRTIGRASIAVAMILSAVGLVATGSFAGALGVILGILLIEFLMRRTNRVAPLLFSSFILVIVVFLLLQTILRPLMSQRMNQQFGHGEMVPRTLLFRFEVWRDVFLPPICENFPWAVSPTVPDHYAWQFEESQYIMLLFRTGLLGLLGHLAWIGITLGWLKRLLGRSENFSRVMVTATLALIIVLSISGLTNAVFTYSGAADFLWIMLALVANREVSP